MNKYDKFKKYVLEEGEDDSSMKHVFYKVSLDAISSAEKRIRMSFPKELKELYKELGYGFLCRQSDIYIDRIMHPDEIADFILCEGEYEFIDKSIYSDNEIPFFHISGEDFITYIVDNISSDVKIMYFGECIASSILEFIEKMDNTADYFAL